MDYGMKWSIAHGLDGVITDDPKRYLEVVEEWEAGNRDPGRVRWTQRALMMWINVLVIVFGFVFKWKYGGKRQGTQIEKAKLIAAKGER